MKYGGEYLFGPGGEVKHKRLKDRTGKKKYTTLYEQGKRRDVVTEIEEEQLPFAHRNRNNRSGDIVKG